MCLHVHPAYFLLLRFPCEPGKSEQNTTLYLLVVSNSFLGKIITRFFWVGHVSLTPVNHYSEPEQYKEHIRAGLLKE